MTPIPGNAQDRPPLDADRLVIISGCSSAGKSTLLAELCRRGHPVVEEPGRRIVKDELKLGGSVLPWVDPVAFARRALAVALNDRAMTGAPPRWVFFDRSAIDAAAALRHHTGEPALAAVGQSHRYHRRVFMAPPWPELYVVDAERRHDLDAAVAEYERLAKAYSSLGYAVFILPKVPVTDRANFVLDTLGV